MRRVGCSETGVIRPLTPYTNINGRIDTATATTGPGLRAPGPVSVRGSPAGISDA